MAAFGGWEVGVGRMGAREGERQGIKDVGEKD